MTEEINQLLPHIPEELYIEHCVWYPSPAKGSFMITHNTGDGYVQYLRCTSCGRLTIVEYASIYYDKQGRCGLCHVPADAECCWCKTKAMCRDRQSNLTCLFHANKKE